MLIYISEITTTFAQSDFTMFHFPGARTSQFQLEHLFCNHVPLFTHHILQSSHDDLTIKIHLPKK